MYRVLGRRGGPNVAFRAIVAFVLPVVVFMAALAGSGLLLRGISVTQRIETIVSFAIASAATVVVVFAVKVGRRVFGYRP
jgi:hypothetical protein